MQHGPAREVISEVIRRERPDLVVLGTHGRGTVKQVLLGSVAEEVLRTASSPVLTVGPECVPPDAKVADFNSVLLVTDFGPVSAKAFPFALHFAEDCGAQLVVLHMVPPMPVLDIGPAYNPGAYMGLALEDWQARARQESLRKLESFVPCNAKMAHRPEYVCYTDFLPSGILDTADRYEAKLILMGANRAESPRLTAHIPWSVVHEVLCKAKCPVLTFRL
jgi:nucleotide-binding universal stress UspA family protein